MFWSVFWASVHYLSILMLFGFLYGELLLWRTGISERNIRTLLWLDIGYGLSALAVLVSGIARAGWTEKGWDLRDRLEPMAVETNESAIAGLKDDEVTILRRALSKMIRNLEHDEKVGASRGLKIPSTRSRNGL